MKKDINIEILNSQNGVIKFNLPQEIKGMKIIDSFLETTVNNVNSNNSYNVKFNCYKVINGIETDIRNDEDTFVDVIKFPNQKLSINISDELQFAIDSEADSLKFTLVNGEALNFSEAFNLKTEYILKTSYKDNASYHNVDLGRSGTASINLSTGDLDIKLPLVSSDKNVLPLAINANYSSVKNEKLPEIGLPNKWSFNLNQFLIEHKDQEKLLFSYIDENSKEHIIEEKYYYKDDNNEEQIVSRENLTLDLDGRLIYNDNGKERLVNTKLEAPSGIKLVSSIGTEHEPEELINIREVIESLENNNSEIENNLYSLKINIFTQCLNSYLSRLQLNLQYLSENDNSDDKSHIEEVIKAIKNKIYSLAIGKEKIIGILKEYIGEEDYNFIFTDNNEIDRIFNEFCESSEIKKTILNEYVVCGSNTEAENSSGIQTINSSFHNTIPNLIDVNCFYTDKNIETYVIQYKKYNEQLESNVNNLKEYKHQKDLYEMRIPVHYLYNDSNVFYGFGKTSKDGFDGNDKVYRLILITDSYENMISIDYESFEDNKVKSIVDSANKTINFDYDVDDKNTGEKYKCIITDSRDRKVKIKEVNSGLRIIHVDGESSNFYFGDKHIIKVLNQNGLGVNFTYDNDKVSSISQISALVKDENGKIKLNNELNFNVVPIDSLLNKKDTITFSYNNYMSTTITNAKNKKITYLFDKYGKVKTQYESFIKQRESQENGESAIIEYISREVALFDYKDTKVNRKIKNLPYSKNYLHGAVFTNSNEIAMAEDYFGETYCSEDVYATDYSIFENSHVMSSSNQEVKDSLTMCQDMIDELNDRNSFCSHRTFVVTGWALANSAFIVTDEEESFPEYITKRTFGLLVKVTYEDGEVAQFKQSFDWRNIDWQLCAVPVSLADKNISGIECTISYSYNTGNIVYTDLEFKEATYDEIIYDSLLRPKTIKSAHSEWQTMLEYDGDTNNILRETFKKVDSTTQEELESFDNTYIYNKEGKLIKSINYNGIVNEQVYNDKGQVIKTMTYHKDEPATKFYEEKILDEKGNHLNEVNGLGQTTNNYKYVDGTGIVENITDENGVKVSYGYDEADTLLQMTSTIDNMTNTNIYGYELDHLTSLKHNDFEIGYKYDIWGRLFKIQIANNDYLTKTYKDNEETTELVVDETTKLTFKQAKSGYLTLSKNITVV